MKKRIFLTIIVFVAVFLATGAAKIKAGTGETGRGWLWGGGAEVDGSAPWDGTNTNVGWISMNNINPEIILQGIIPYGVNIPSGDGLLRGYAWSENMGYIAFDNSDGYLNGCPDGNCVAKRVGNALQGWARFVEISNASAINNSGGWSGWIKLNGIAQDSSPYGITIAPDKKLSGYAWSDELGWIDFSRSTVVCTTTYSNYICKNNNSIDCSLPENCNKSEYYANCVATNSCTSNTDSIDISNPNCGTCTPIAGNCDNSACSGGGSPSSNSGTWREVAP